MRNARKTGVSRYPANEVRVSIAIDEAEGKGVPKGVIFICAREYARRRCIDIAGFPMVDIYAAGKVFIRNRAGGNVKISVPVDIAKSY